MQDYTICENYTLPSLGKIYTVEFDPNIKIRSMTTEEEMKRLANTDEPYKNICEIIDDCIVGGLPISSRDMAIGDYQFLLHKLRVVTYGADYKISSKCSYCGYTTEDTINLDELPIVYYTEDYEKVREFDLPKTGVHIRLKPQTPRMIDEVSAEAKEIRKRRKNLTYDPSLVLVMKRLIESIDGGVPNPVKVEDWLKSLPMADTNTIVAHADKMNESIGVSVDLTCECDICGLSFNTKLKTTAEFFRPALDI